MEPSALAFFERIVETPSPSGYEQPVQEAVRQYVAEFADEIRTDVHGSVIAVKNPQGRLRLMLAGHCDQIGLIVSHIDDDGFLFIQQIGGWDPQMLVGQQMTVWTDKGPLAGVIGRKAVHMLTDRSGHPLVSWYMANNIRREWSFIPMSSGITTPP